MNLRRTSAAAFALGICVSFASASGDEPDANETTVIARGIGATAQSANRDAIMNAVYQAVGSYVDGETLIANDQLIKEQILQSSGSYVQRYDVLSEPKQRDDMLWETTVRAVVRGGQVQERLKTVDIGQTGIAVEDQVAEALSKMQNAKDGARILESHLQGLLPKLLVARLIDLEGKASDQIRPKIAIQGDGSLSCTWHVEIYFDAKTFYEKVVPPLDQILSATSSHSGGPVESISELGGRVNMRYNRTYLTEYPIYGDRDWRGAEPAKPQGDQPHVYFLLSTGRNATGGVERFQWYLLEGVDYFQALRAAQPKPVVLNVEFLADDGGVIWREGIDPWRKCLLLSDADKVGDETFRPYFLTPIYSESIPSNALLSPAFSWYGSISHRDRPAYYADGWGPAIDGPHGDTIVRSFTVTLAPEDLERIKQVRFHFEEGAPVNP